MAYHIEALHRWYFESDGSHYVLATAYAHLWRNEEAIAEFSRIRGPLPSSEAEDERHLNLALCLARLGNWRRSAEVLRSYQPDTWSSSSHREHHAQLIASVEFNETFEREVWPRVQQASGDEDWATVVHLLQPLHQKGFGTCTTLLLEADAYGAMREWNKCLKTLDNIGEMSPYSGLDLNARFLWLKALALLKLGRRRDYDELLSQFDALPTCPPDIRDQLNLL